MNWTEVLITVDSQAVEAVTNILYEFGAQGVAIDEPIDVEKLKEDELYWDYIDEKLLEDGNEETKIMAYFSEEERNLPEKIMDIREHIKNLKDFGLEIGSATVELSNINQDDWETAWKQYFKPIHVTDKIVVKPEWEVYEKQSDEIVIEIDPGMAFGTGTHETTSMCINQIEKNLKKGDKIIDIGCGSGILAMAAVLLGAQSAVGVDLDPVAVRVSKENIVLNRLNDKIEIFEGNLTDVIKEKAEIVVANIMADIIVILLEDVRDFIKDGGLFISSGIILPKRELIEKTLMAKSFKIIEVETKGEWCAITAQKMPLA